MKVLRLGFKNLNSLAGVWELDFSHPDYVSSGIFAITGPTGAGKTTILDAICLALYGQTPRLGRITQSENEIMSRQTGECFAEVEFETARGRFRCHWSQHRSRKTADGQLQLPRHEIAEAGSGLILESKLKAVVGKVEDVTGMDFDRFTRSMLLAQGSFAAFLQAGADERAPILEQITGTAIYSRISMKVHERTTEERKKLETIRVDLNGVQLLSPEEEADLLREQKEKQLEEKALSVFGDGIRDAQAWRERLALLESELSQLEATRCSLDAEKHAAAPELAILANARRTVALEGDYANLAAVRKQQGEEHTEISDIVEKLPTLRLGLQTAVELVGLAETEFKKAQDEQQRESDLIRLTRILDVKLDEANSQLKELQADCAAIRHQGDEYRSTVTAREGEIATTGALLRDNGDNLRERSRDAGLVEALTGMEQQVKMLKALNLQCTERRTKLEQQVSAVKSAEQARQQADMNWRAASQAVAAAGDRLGVLQSARDTRLQGRELSSWREESDTLRTRLKLLENLRDAVARIEGTRQRLAALQARLSTLERTRQRLAGLEEDTVRECGLREDVIRQLQDKLVLLNRVRDLEEERIHLIDGVPCPLCGSIEHPYAAGNVPRPDVAQKELEHARALFKSAGERLSSARSDLVGVTKEMEQAQREQQESLEQQALDEPQCAAGFNELALPADAATRGEIIRNELDLCQLALKNSREVIGEAERMEQAVSQAKTALDTVKDELNKHDKARHAAELGCRTVSHDLERLKLECEAVLGDFDRALAEAECTFEPYGCTELALNTIDGVMVSLTVRRNDYVHLMQEMERLEKGLADLNGKKSRLTALRAQTEQNLLIVEQRLHDSTSHRDNLAGQRRDLFGERNPDSEEQRLAAMLSQAGERRDEALRDQSRLHNEINGLVQQQQKLAESIRRRTEQLLTLETALQLRMTDAGFPDEASFLQARLPQARFDELSILADGLQRQELEIQTRCRDRASAYQQELDRKLSEKTLDRIREENAAVTMQLSELHRALGGIEQKLQQHAEQQLRQKDRLLTMELQKRECVRWERLHSLIGSGDGKKFRNFAQGLTFELMIAHANRQLQKMSDRYILVRDSAEPLELNVIDNYQAGEIRSTRNLSGGESFIASLALSLGLSGMASHNVRVDSLFLDEGFGTLDEDALETALETLSALQQDGKLIGIISHVPALKERIGTRIQVESGSSGRSRLSGPGCRRVS